MPGEEGAVNNPIKAAQLQIGLKAENWICPPVGDTGFCHPWDTF